MTLRVQHVEKTHFVKIDSDKVKEALELIFKEPNYFLSRDEDGDFQAIGIDLLRSSVITQYKLESSSPLFGVL